MYIYMKNAWKHFPCIFLNHFAVYYLTVILRVAFFLLKVVTVMVAFPFFFAVTLPLADTVATFLLLVL